VSFFRVIVLSVGLVVPAAALVVLDWYARRR
jgi:hypothetical protein